VWGQGAFGALPAATANGACTFDVTGGTKYTLTVPASNGATGLAIEYCFVSNQVRGASGSMLTQHCCDPPWFGLATRLTCCVAVNCLVVGWRCGSPCIFWRRC